MNPILETLELSRCSFPEVFKYIFGSSIYLMSVFLTQTENTGSGRTVLQIRSRTYRFFFRSNLFLCTQVTSVVGHAFVGSSIGEVERQAL